MITNTCLVKMIETLVSYIEQNAAAPTMTPFSQLDQAMRDAFPALYTAAAPGVTGQVWDGKTPLFAPAPAHAYVGSWDDYCKNDIKESYFIGTPGKDVSRTPTGLVGQVTVGGSETNVEILKDETPVKTRRKPGRKPGQKLIKPLDPSKKVETND